jgi:hypothetical protein
MMMKTYKSLHKMSSHSGVDDTTAMQRQTSSSLQGTDLIIIRLSKMHPKGAFFIKGENC